MKKPQIFICLDDELTSGLIMNAKKTIIYAGPAISLSIAEAIMDKKKMNPSLMIRVIINADAESLQLGFGKLEATKMLWNGGIDVRCAPGLRIGALVVDDRSWIFSPTPEIILDKPSAETQNAVTINPSFTKWLMFAMAPMEGLSDMAREYIEGRSVNEELRSSEPHDEDASDEILEEQILDDGKRSLDETLDQTIFEPNVLDPQIGANPITEKQIVSIDKELEDRPPKQFDKAREILVYNGHLQFVDLKFTGGRLSARTIRLPDYLLNIAESREKTLEIKASCRLFENVDVLCPDLKEFEQLVGEVRRCYTQSLGAELGSVILAKNRVEFDKEIKILRDDLVEICKTVKRIIDKAIQDRKAGLIKILLPLLLNNPPEWMWISLDEVDDKSEYVSGVLNNILDEILPSAQDLTENMELRCTFKDVTWETLNEPEFADAIKAKFPDEGFTKLYEERNTIGERQKSDKRIINEGDWPDQIDDEPTGF